MQLSKILTVILSISLFLTACGKTEAATEVPAPAETVDTVDSGSEAIPSDSTIGILLDDSNIKVDGSVISSEPSNAVYIANDIVYYESGKDFTYGEGTESDAHTAEEAAAHTVVHITEAGTYRLSGKLSKGQIAVDLGKDAKNDPSAVVTLILDGIDITCEVAPAVIFYNVYECGSADTAAATKDVDTSAAGANVIIADGSNNFINGSHVARIYKPDSVVLSEDGTEVIDEKKLHKYDAAFYSKMSMNVDGGELGDGKLTIKADNEGLDTELHLTINGGIIEITSGNDGINTNEDGVSVTAINGGTLKITVSGETGEGDGIDSNGWLVINGGSIFAYACSTSADSGIDSDMGIHINGGTVTATGNMLDRIEDGGQTYAVFSFASKQKRSDTVSVVNEAGGIEFTAIPKNDFSNLLISYPELEAGTYTVYSNGNRLEGYKGGNIGSHGGMMPPDDMTPPEGIIPPEGEQPSLSVPPIEITPPEGNRFEWELPPEVFEAYEGSRPEGEPPHGGRVPPEGKELPNDMNRPGSAQKPNRGFEIEAVKLSEEFIITEGGNIFSGVKCKE